MYVKLAPLVQSPPRTTVDIPQRMVRRLEPNIGNTRDARRVSLAREILSRNHTASVLPSMNISQPPLPDRRGKFYQSHTPRHTPLNSHNHRMIVTRFAAQRSTHGPCPPRHVSRSLSMQSRLTSVQYNPHTSKNDPS
jgi:hypothetical protein